MVYADEATAFRAMQALNGRLFNGSWPLIVEIQVDLEEVPFFMKGNYLPTSAPPTSMAESLYS